MKRTKVLATLFALCLALATNQTVQAADDPLAGFRLPADWQGKFWNESSGVALCKKSVKEVVDLVPSQAGLKFCRCPKCDSEERDETLVWSIENPKVVTCKHCGTSMPGDAYPAKVDGKIPSESIEVRKGLAHVYPYHLVDAIKQRFPDERLYLEAKRDYETRNFLSKAALYAAIRHRDTPRNVRDPWFGQLAAGLLIRFSQVYPDYALHFDQPGRPKQFEAARRPPPYRHAYQTAKWDWIGSQEIPVNLVIAYAILRDDPMLIDVGKALKEPRPGASIETRLFRQAATFLADQSEEISENSFEAMRGLLIAGLVLKDDALLTLAESRLTRLAEHGFYHDGVWSSGDAATQRRIVGLFDGWFGQIEAARTEIPLLALARSANTALSLRSSIVGGDVLRTNWPAPEVGRAAGRPTLLGGAGIARLRVGEGPEALDLELQGLATVGLGRFQRQSLRIAVGGQPIIDDLDEYPERADGWDRASASHNTVIVDGLNQRENLANARTPTLGGDFRFFAADPDFQVTVLDDPRAYPQSTTRYRQILVASSGPSHRYAVSVFEVRGGLQHDQIFHGPTQGGRIKTALSLEPGPDRLLPPTIPFLSGGLPSEGRWFVQAYGFMKPIGQARVDRGTTAIFQSYDRDVLRLHLLSDPPLDLIQATTPATSGTQPNDLPSPENDRSALLMRRRTGSGENLNSLFVNVFEPIGAQPNLTRVGRVDSPPGTVVLLVESKDGPEYLVINLSPGTRQSLTLVDGRLVQTDAQVVRVQANRLAMAGGTHATCGELHVSQPATIGTIVAVGRDRQESSRGWFETSEVVTDPGTLAGRTLLIRHGDQTSHGWTLGRAERLENGRTRFHVKEEPGFLLPQGPNGVAAYYQFPRLKSPGPHRFKLDRIARSDQRNSAVSISR